MTPAKTKSEKKQKRKQLSYKRFQEGKSRSSLVDDKTVIDIFVVTTKAKNNCLTLFCYNFKSFLPVFG